MPYGESVFILAFAQAKRDTSIVVTVICGCSLLVFRQYSREQFADLIDTFDGHIAMLCTNCDTMHWPRFVLADAG